MDFEKGVAFICGGDEWHCVTKIDIANILWAA